MLDDDWFEFSLAGDLDSACRVQYRQSLEARHEMDCVNERPEDLLSDKRVPAPSCPGFDRLDAIMSISRDIDKTLASYRPIWSSNWAATMTTVNEEENDAAQD